MNGRVTDPRPSSAPREHELLARLGLGPGASNDEVEAAHDEILDYLAKAPGALRGWARVQLTDADEAYARLNGAPASASYAEPAAYAETIPPPAPLAGSAAARTQRVAGPTIRGDIDDDLEGFFDEPGEPDGPVVVTRRDRRAAQAQAARAQVARGQGAVRVRPGSTVAGQRGNLRRLGAVVAGLALVAGIVLGVYSFAPGGLPGINGTPEPAASGGLDTAQVAALMQKIAANPNDTVALTGLANLYYQSGDYATAETWLQKVLAIDPKNVDALLALGAANFNLGDDASAQTAWEQVLTIDSKNVEAHYDLGFMYFSQNPPNVAKVCEQWGLVVTLDAGSTIAQTVQTHLAQLTGAASAAPGASPATGCPASKGSPAPSGSAGPTGSGAPAGSPVPAASPAASPAPSPKPAAS